MKEKKVLRRVFGLICAVMLSLALAPLCALAEPADEMPAPPEAGDTVISDIIVDVDSDGVNQYTIYGANIPVEYGTYWYSFIFKETGAFVIDNYLLVSYQGVDGKFSLRYAGADSVNQDMIVYGSFDNVLATSSLVSDDAKAAITDDNYFYTLDLKTNEGYTLSNKLQYKYNGVQEGYRVNYTYDLATDTQTIDVLDLDGNPVDDATRDQVLSTMWYFYNTYVASTATLMNKYMSAYGINMSAYGITFPTNTFVKIGGQYYYFGNNGQIVYNSFVKYGGKYYYMGADANPVVNDWVRYGGKYYYMGADGTPVVNDWVRYGDTYYYMGADGTPVVNGWVRYAGKYYYMGADGTPVVDGWVRYAGKWYYMGADGTPVVDGWVVYGNTAYHFNKSGYCDYSKAA